MSNMLPGGLGGAVDLSSLRNRSDAASAPQSTAANPAPAGESLGVASLVMDVTPATLSKFVKISERVPVMVEFHTLRSEGSMDLSKKLAAEVVRRGGEIVLLRIDGDTAGELLRAFQVTGLPAVAALLLGQPVPLFNGNQDAEVITQVLDKMLQLAKENQVTGRAEVDANAQAPIEPALPPRHRAGYDAIEAGNYAQAVAEFEAAIRENPADAVAATGLAQSQLLLRTDGLDYDAILQNPATALADVILKADVLSVIGHFDKAFDALLTTFEVADKDDRDKLRNHLLELFRVAGSGNPAIAPARARLTNLLY